MAPDGQAWSTAGSTSAAAAGASTTGRGVTLRNDLPDSGTPLRVGGGEVTTAYSMSRNSHSSRRSKSSICIRNASLR